MHEGSWPRVLVETRTHEEQLFRVDQHTLLIAMSHHWEGNKPSDSPKGVEMDPMEIVEARNRNQSAPARKMQRQPRIQSLRFASATEKDTEHSRAAGTASLALQS